MAKKLLLALSLCASISTFCMEGRLEKEARFPDDGQQWTFIQNENDMKPFCDKMVLYRYVSTILKSEKMYQINPEDPTFCGIINATGKLLSYCRIGDNNICRSNNLAYVPILCEDPSFSIRLLKLSEVKHLHEAKKIDKISCYDFQFQSQWPEFKVSNLVPEEQRRYVHNHSESLHWLHLINHRENERKLPAEIIHRITQNVIDFELQNSDTVLKFD